MLNYDYENGGGTVRARPASRVSVDPLGTARKFAASMFQSASTSVSLVEVVTLLKGGEVRVTAPDCVGVSWRLDPGPTHLDTCYISVDTPRGSFIRPPGGSETLAPRGEREVLTFMGYVDRGQRIESRFSKRLVRMSGMVLSSGSEGLLRSSEPGRAVSRFIMEKANAKE